MKKSQSLMFDLYKQIKEEILSHQLIYLLLSIVLLLSAFFRLYKIDKLLGFWYDQGRDALVIWDLLHYRKLFLIGPVTGIEGIFLGPFYYYLLAPFYWLGKGSPVLAAAFLSWLSVGTIFLIYWLAKEIYGRKTGLLAAFLYGFSYEFILFSRWLANPNPLPFFTLLTLIFLLFSVKKKSSYLIPASFFAGLCLQLEAASAIFFLPAIFTIIIWQRKKLFRLKILLPSALLFLLTLLPQLIFNFRHEGILLSAFNKFLLKEKSFKLSFFQVFWQRLVLYYNVSFGKFFSFHQRLNTVPSLLFFLSLIFSRKKIFSSEGKLLLIWFFSPLIGFLFYRGNHNYIWDYYFSGVMPVFIILFSAGLVYLSEKKLFKILICSFLLVFLLVNLSLIKSHLNGGAGITLGAELKALDWIYIEAKNDEFNIDVYVPPNIYFSYSYLFKWYGKGKFGREPETKLVKNLYTISEPDGERPFLLERWLKRQDGIGKIVKNYSWEDVTVQKRERLKFND